MFILSFILQAFTVHIVVFANFQKEKFGRKNASTVLKLTKEMFFLMFFFNPTQLAYKKTSNLLSSIYF